MERKKSSGLLSAFAGLAMLGAAALNSGCVSAYTPEIRKLPEDVECNEVTRWIPGDKVYYPVWAAGKGLGATGYEFLYMGVRSCCIGSPVTLAHGAVATTLDTAINLVVWPYLEVKEMATGKTWAHPWTPNSDAIFEGIRLDMEKEGRGLDFGEDPELRKLKEQTEYLRRLNESITPSPSRSPYRGY